MLTLTQRINTLVELGGFLRMGADGEMEAAFSKAYFENRWFTQENCQKAVQQIAEQLLSEKILLHAAETLQLEQHQPNPKTIALVPAGNVPLQGFSDWLAVFLSGHHARIKLHEKDKVLLPFLLATLGEIQPEAQTMTYFLIDHERLGSFDAVIADDAGEKADLFQKYFSKYPNLIRKKRTSVAVLTGEESQAELFGLSDDLIGFFGLNSLAVSKLYVPKGYDFMPLLETLFEHKHLIQHDKYKNNYDYNLTLFILNKINHHTSGNLLIREERALFSRIASAHFEEYAHSSVASVARGVKPLATEATEGGLKTLITQLMENDQIEQVVCGEKLRSEGFHTPRHEDKQTTAFGKAQLPRFPMEAMRFLSALG